MSEPEPSEEDKAAAHDIAHDIYRCNDPHMNKQHSDTCDRIASAIRDARLAENKACEDELRPWFVNPTFGVISKVLAGRIASRRKWPGPPR